MGKQCSSDHISVVLTVFLNFRSHFNTNPWIPFVFETLIITLSLVVEDDNDIGLYASIHGLLLHLMKWSFFHIPFIYVAHTLV